MTLCDSGVFIHYEMSIAKFPFGKVYSLRKLLLYRLRKQADTDDLMRKEAKGERAKTKGTNDIKENNRMEVVLPSITLKTTCDCFSRK